MLLFISLIYIELNSAKLCFAITRDNVKQGVAEHKNARLSSDSPMGHQ